MVLSLIVPFWVNEILRAFAFRIIFGSAGVINGALLWLGVIDQPVDLIRENIALYTGLTYAFILLMIFPLYNAIESLDRNQIEAARDMGASWFRIHWRVVIPFAKPGISSGCTMVFMLTAGAPRRAADPRRPEQPLVHPDHLSVVQHREQPGRGAPPTRSSCSCRPSCSCCW